MIIRVLINYILPILSIFLVSILVYISLHKRHLKTAVTDRLLLFILLAFSVFYMCTLNSHIGTNGDNARYLILAKSIAEGTGLRQIYMPGSPPYTGLNFGFPLLLTPFAKICFNNILTIKLLPMAATIIALLILYTLVKRLYGYAVALIVIILTGINFSILSFSHQIMTENIYLLFSSVVLLIAINVINDKRNQYFNVFLLSALVFFAFTIRSIGLALFISVLIAFALRKKVVPLAIIISTFFILIAPFILRQIIVSNSALGEGGYINQFLMQSPYTPDYGRVSFMGIFYRIFVNARLYFTLVIPYMLSATKLKWFMWLLVVPFFVGYFKKNRNDSLIKMYLAIYILPCLLFNVVVSRYIIPILPFLLLYFVTGCQKLLSILGHRIKNGKRIEKILFAVIIVFVFLPHTYKDLKHIEHEQAVYYYSPEWRGYFTIANWARDNTPPDCIISCRKQALFWFRARRKTIGYPFTKDKSKVLKYILTNKADYVVLDAFKWTDTTERFLKPVILAYPDIFKFKIYPTAHPSTRLYKVVPSIISSH